MPDTITTTPAGDGAVPSVFRNAMVERVACAISGAPFSTVRSRAKARKVLRAMRDPTIDMEVAGTEQWLCEACQEDRSGTNWRAMIDAAISEDDPILALAAAPGAEADGGRDDGR